MTDAKTDAVLFEDIPTASHHRFGVATLNAPSALNALTLEMVRALAPALRRWASDDAIAGVVLQATGDRAFCAGADLRTLYASLRANPGEPGDYARAFFAEEYEVDYAIHTFTKPILCWGQGIVMGGGIGLMSGASHRVVTPTSKLAMPEITIGLFPDVGGSWLLERMPGGLGRFLALTGTAIDAADARFCGLADAIIPDDARTGVFDAIRARRWTGHAPDDRAELSRLLAERSVRDLPAGSARRNFDRIDELMAGNDLHEIATRLHGVAAPNDDAWLVKAAAAFAHGSPTTAALAFELQRRVRQLSLADVFRLEYNAALGCCAHANLVEGIRALLIDKDRTPHWNPASLAEVTPALVEDHLRPRYEGAHPLAALGAPHA